jgi:hypothetical protein
MGCGLNKKEDTTLFVKSAIIPNEKWEKRQKVKMKQDR